MHNNIYNTYIVTVNAEVKKASEKQASEKKASARKKEASKKKASEEIIVRKRDLIKDVKLVS